MNARIPEYKIIEKNGMKIHEKTKEDYESLWEIFSTKYKEEFEEMMNYPISEIERIGTEKFIDMYDWRNEDDIKSFPKSDNAVMICDECRDDFGIAPIDHGLCQKCLQLYDFDLFYRFLDEKESADEKAYIDLMFMYDQELRNAFKKSVKSDETV